MVQETDKTAPQRQENQEGNGRQTGDARVAAEFESQTVAHFDPAVAHQQLPRAADSMSNCAHADGVGTANPQHAFVDVTAKRVHGIGERLTGDVEFCQMFQAGFIVIQQIVDVRLLALQQRHRHGMQIDAGRVGSAAKFPH